MNTKSPFLTGSEEALVFGYLSNSFLDDYDTKQMPREQSGWRTRTTIAEDTHVPNVSFYGKGGRFGPVLKETNVQRADRDKVLPWTKREGRRSRQGEGSSTTKKM